MAINEHIVDRIIRVVIGITIFLVIWFMGPGWQISKWWAFVGLLPVATGLIGNCPLYSIFGINTCTLKKKS